MIDASIIDDLATKLSQLIPPEIKKAREEVHQQFKQVLQAQLAKMDLITREEFDIQTQVLQKTRAKVELLQTKLQELENKCS